MKNHTSYKINTLPVLFKFVEYMRLYVGLSLAITRNTRQLRKFQFLYTKLGISRLKYKYIYISIKTLNKVMKDYTKNRTNTQRRKSNFKTNRWIEKNNQISSVQYPIFYLIYYLFLFSALFLHSSQSQI